MRWTPGGRSDNVEDRRGEGGPRRIGFGGTPMRLGLGGTLVLLVLSLLFGQNFFAILDPGVDAPVQPRGPEAPAPGTPGRPSGSPEEEELVQFVSFVLDDVQVTWTRLLPDMGARYPEAKLVLFRGAIASACGTGESAMGPFYCPLDRKVYVDLSFYGDLRRRFGAPGDFAQAYVIAHEIGHHVQNVLGIADKVRRAQSERPPQAKQLSVRLELQADCFAGVWAHSTAKRDLLERGDVEEGLNAAAAIGDDRLQRRGSGQVVPEAFTHGSSAQRVRWFRQGLTSGQPGGCDTFSAREP